MSQIKLQSLIFLCPVCNITKYVNIQKYINNILNVNKHKLTCPLCINNYIGINNLIIHIITDHKNLLSVTDGNVSVNLNNFAGNSVITNVETICGDWKIRERHVDNVKTTNKDSTVSNNTVNVDSNHSKPFVISSNPYTQAFTIDDLGQHSKRTNEEYVPESSTDSPIIINPGSSDLVILESVPNDTFGTRITTSPVEYTGFDQAQQGVDKQVIDCTQVNCSENSGHFLQKIEKGDGTNSHIVFENARNDKLESSLEVKTDNKVPEEMCFIDNSFCDKFFDYNKFKDAGEIDGLKFDIDQFLNEMSNANLSNNDTEMSKTEVLPNNDHLSNSAKSNQILHLENASGGMDKSNFVWNEVNSMNQLFNMNQMTLLQTNVILEDSSKENQTDKQNNMYISKDESKPMEDILEAPCDKTQILPNNIAHMKSKQFDGTIQSIPKDKLLNNSHYKNIFQVQQIGNKRIKSNFEDTKTNRLKVFKEKQNKFKNQRLKKLQLLTMNKKFEDHLSLDEARHTMTLDLTQNKIPSPNAYGIAILKNGGDFATTMGHNDLTSDIHSKHARILSEETSVKMDVQHQGTELFKCETCSFLFQNADILAMHNQLIHNHTVRKPTGQSGDDPMKAEGGGFSNKCSYCPRVFKMKGSLMIHLKVAHMGLSNSSSSKVSSSSKLESKGANVSPPQSFSCTLCSKSFKKEPHLLQHLKTHEGKQWECKLCSKLFTTKYFLKKHNRLHTGEMPYKCHQCDKQFTFQQSFHKHLLYHSDEKPHVCASCGRAFKELSTLHNHERIHSGEKPFCCEICGK